MSDQPPDEPKSPWDEIAKQVQSALRDLPLADEAHTQIMEDLRSMMSSLGVFGIPLAPADPQAPPPDISVVAGGRTEELSSYGEPEMGIERPDLKVAPDPITEDEPSAEVNANSDSGFSWHTLGDLGKAFVLPSPTSSAAPGDIRLSGSNADEGSQTLYTGTQLRPYRIYCGDGSMRIVVDGKSDEVLRAGRSVDVEGALIRVILEEGSAALGTYQRLP